MNKNFAKLLASAAVVVVAATAANADAFKGFYAGGLLGATQNNVEFKLFSDDQGNVLYKKNYNKRGLLFAAVGGWGQTFANSMYVGGELSLSYGTANQKKEHTMSGQSKTGASKVVSFSTNYKRGPVLGLAMRTGYVFAQNTLAYAKLGLEISRDSLTWSDGFSQTDGKARKTIYANDGATSETIKKTAVRPVLGFGLEYAMTKNISLRGEYAYTFKGPAIKSADDGVVESQARATSHSLLAGVAYHF